MVEEAFVEVKPSNVCLLHQLSLALQPVPQRLVLDPTETPDAESSIQERNADIEPLV